MTVSREVLDAGWKAYCEAPTMRDMGRSKVDAAVVAAIALTASQPVYTPQQMAASFRAGQNTERMEVGEVQGDGLAMIGSNLRSILSLCKPEGQGISRIDAANVQHEARHALLLLDAALASRQPAVLESGVGPGPYLDEADAHGNPLWKRLRSIANLLTVLTPNSYMEAAEVLLTASDRIKQGEVAPQVGGAQGDARERDGWRKMQKSGASQTRKDGVGACDALYELAVKSGASDTEAAGFAHHVNGAFALLECQVHDGLHRESGMDTALAARYPAGQISVATQDATNYCLILTALGMEEEGDPVEAVQELVKARDRQLREQMPVAHMVRWRAAGGWGLNMPSEIQWFRDRADEYEIRDLVFADAIQPAQGIDLGPDKFRDPDHLAEWLGSLVDGSEQEEWDAAQAAMQGVRAYQGDTETLRRLQAAVEGECDGLAITPEQAAAIFDYVLQPLNYDDQRDAAPGVGS